MTHVLDTFVREALARRTPREAIRTTLGDAGWRADEIDAALSRWADVEFPIPVPRRMPSLSAREAFLYLVLFATLYLTAFHAGQVLFELIEYAFPDPLWRAGAGFSSATVRAATAALVIAFPIWLFVSRQVEREIARDPEKRGSGVRKWLTYLTLFLAALVMIGDMIFLVTRILSGELPLCVLLKVLVVFVIAGATFGWYLTGLRREEDATAVSWRRSAWIPRIAVAAVLAVITSGLLFSGTPARERRRQMDVRRVEDLQAISRAVQAWHRQNGRFPKSLDELLREPDAYAMVPSTRDPATGVPYEYATVDASHFQLCATFESSDSLVSRLDPRGVSGFWKHPAGRACFTLRARENP